MFFRHFLNDFKMVPLAAIITFHTRSIQTVRFLQVKIFLAPFLLTFLSPEYAMFIKRHVPFSIITHHDVQFVVTDDFVTFYLLISENGHLTLHYLFLVTAVDIDTCVFRCFWSSR